jgi:hypothetical protein
VNLEKVWSELERQSPPTPGIIRRRVEERSGRDLYAGLHMPSRDRMLILEVGADTISEVKLPSTSALYSTVAHVEGDDGRAELRISLVAPEMKRVFTPFAEDVISAVALTHDDEASVAVLLQRFNYWRRLLSGSGQELLSSSEALGLYSELWVFRHLLAPVIGTSRATASWQGPQRARRDFVVGGLGLEVKSTALSTPSQVVILDERQLADDPFASLYLVALELDIVTGGVGETLNQMVDSAIELADADGRAAELRDRILQYGYSELHQTAYLGSRYTLRELSIFKVEGAFPRIVESDLREGVSQVRYRLTLSACQPWRCDQSVLISDLNKTKEALDQPADRR